MRPRNSVRVPRPRLTDPVLNAPAGSIWIVRAPIGHGKSALLSDIAHQVGVEKSILFGVAKATTSREAFWDGLAFAWRSWFPAEENRRFNRIRATMTDTAPDGWAYLNIESAPCLTQPIYLLIDEFENVADSRVGLDLVGLTKLHPALKLVVASRKCTVFDSMALHLQANIQQLSRKNLLLNDHEIETLVAEASTQSGISVPGTDDIVSVTHRIPLLVRIASFEISRGGAGNLTRIRDLVHPLIQNLLRETVALSELPHFIETLTSLSAADIITADLADTLLGHDSAAVLAEIESLGLGLTDQQTFQDGAGNQWSEPVLTIIQPILDALQSELQQRPARWREGRRVFSRWALESGLSEMSLAAGLDAQDLDLCNEIVVGRIVSLLKSRGTVSQLLGNLSQSTLVMNPPLAAALALDYFSSADRQWKSREMFGIALAGISSKKRSVGPWDKLIYTAIRMLAARLVALNSNETLRLASQVAQQIGELPINNVGHYPQILPVLINQVCATLLFRGEVQPALKAITSGSTAAPLVISMPNDRFHALSLKAAAYALAGELDAASHAAESSVLIPGTADQRYSYNGGTARLAEAYGTLEAGRFDQALEILSEFDHRLETIEYAHLLISAHTWVFIGQNRSVEGITWLSDLHTRLDRQRPLASYVDSHLNSSAMLLALCADDFHSAQRYFEQTRGLHKLERAILGARLALAHNSAELVKSSDPLVKFGTGDARTLRERLDLSLLKAAVATQHNNFDVASRYAREASAIVSRTGMSLPLVAFGAANIANLSNHIEIPAELQLAFKVNADAISHGPKQVTIALPRLTKREKAVLRELTRPESFTVEQIAARLSVSANTIRTQMKSIYTKLGVTSRKDAVQLVFDAQASHLWND